MPEKSREGGGLGEQLPAQSSRRSLDPFDPAWVPASPTEDVHGDAAADDPLLGQLPRLLASATSPSTRRAYASDWRRFTAWCTARNRITLPADRGPLPG